MLKVTMPLLPHRSMAAKGEDLDAEEGDRHAEDGREQVARERRQAEQIVADEDDGVLDDVVRHVGEEELDVARGRHARREDEEAVEQIRIAIAQQIADVECEVRIAEPPPIAIITSGAKFVIISAPFFAIFSVGSGSTSENTV